MSDGNDGVQWNLSVSTDTEVIRLGVNLEGMRYNKKMNYCGRAKQTVTLDNKLENVEQVRVMEVSPHLTIWSPLSLNGNIHGNIDRKIAEL